MSLADFVVSFLGAGAGAALLGFLGRDWLAVRIRNAVESEAFVRRQAFELKRSACLDALDVVDAAFSHRAWTQAGSPIPIIKQPLEIAKARRCYNQLALTCDDPKVILAYVAALGLRTPEGQAPQVSADAIVDLRNAMRTELGFGRTLAVSDRAAAWIASLDGAS